MPDEAMSKRVLYTPPSSSISVSSLLIITLVLESLLAVLLYYVGTNRSNEWLTYAPWAELFLGVLAAFSMAAYQSDSLHPYWFVSFYHACRMVNGAVINFFVIPTLVSQHYLMQCEPDEVLANLKWIITVVIIMVSVYSLFMQSIGYVFERACQKWEEEHKYTPRGTKESV